MKKYIMLRSIIFLLVCCSIFSAPIQQGIQTIKDSQQILNQEQRREQEKQIDELNQKGIKNIDVPLNEIVPVEDEKGSEIKEIYVTGYTVFYKFTIDNITKKYIGKKGGLQIVNLIKELENLYLEAGYVTTRVGIDSLKTDTKNGIYYISIVEGKIDTITINEEENRFINWVTFPNGRDDFLNLRDIDQGVDNLNSTFANNAAMQIMPGKNQGYSDISVANNTKRPYELSFGWNNLGQENTGREKARVGFSYSNLLNINDYFNMYYERGINNQSSTAGTTSYAYTYSFPVKYWTISGTLSRSNYVNTLHTLGNNFYRMNGMTYNKSATVSKVLYRAGTIKITGGTSLEIKDNENYFNGYYLESSSRRLSVIKPNVSLQSKLIGGIFSSSLTYSEGLKGNGATSTPATDGGESSPNPKFKKWSGDISWYKPFNIFKEDFAYKINLSGQYTEDILFGSEQLSIGDDTTVRGFYGNSISGDKGYYIRNELSKNIFNDFTPFIAYDLGAVKNVYQPNTSYLGDSMSGGSIGMRIQKGALSGSLTYSKPFTAPSYIDKKTEVITASVTVVY